MGRGEGREEGKKGRGGEKTLTKDQNGN